MFCIYGPSHTAAGGSDSNQARVNNKCKHSFSAKAPQCPNLDITRHGVHNTITSKCRIKPDIPSPQEQAAGKKAASCRRPPSLCMYIFQTVSMSLIGICRLELSLLKCQQMWLSNCGRTRLRHGWPTLSTVRTVGTTSAVFPQ